MLVNVGKCIGFCVYRWSYLISPPAIAGLNLPQNKTHNTAAACASLRQLAPARDSVTARAWFVAGASHPNCRRRVFVCRASNVLTRARRNWFSRDYCRSCYVCAHRPLQNVTHSPPSTFMSVTTRTVTFVAVGNGERFSLTTMSAEFNFSLRHPCEPGRRKRAMHRPQWRRMEQRGLRSRNGRGWRCGPPSVRRRRSEHAEPHPMVVVSSVRSPVVRINPRHGFLHRNPSAAVRRRRPSDIRDHDLRPASRRCGILVGGERFFGQLYF